MGGRRRRRRRKMESDEAERKFPVRVCVTALTSKCRQSATLVGGFALTHLHLGSSGLLVKAHGHGVAGYPEEVCQGHRFPLQTQRTLNVTRVASAVNPRRRAAEGNRKQSQGIAPCASFQFVGRRMKHVFFLCPFLPAKLCRTTKILQQQQN